MFKIFVQTVLLGGILVACSPAEKQQAASTPAEQSAAALSADKLVLKQALQDLKNETGKTHQQMLTVIREPDSAQKNAKSVATDSRVAPARISSLTKSEIAA